MIINFFENVCQYDRKSILIRNMGTPLKTQPILIPSPRKEAHLPPPTLDTSSGPLYTPPERPSDPTMSQKQKNGFVHMHYKIGSVDDHNSPKRTWTSL